MPKPLTEAQTNALEANIILTDRHGRTPSAAEVAAQLGITKAAARRLMLECASKGYMSAPVQTVVGEWKVNARGRRVVEKRLRIDGAA